MQYSCQNNQIGNIPYMTKRQFIPQLANLIFPPALCEKARDDILRCVRQRGMKANEYLWFIPRCRIQRRISFRAISHNAGFHSALSHTAQDFIPRYLTQHRISFRVVSHSAGCHSALSHTAQLFQLSFRAIAHSAGFHSALSHTAQNFIPRYLTQRRMTFRAVAHSAG